MNSDFDTAHICEIAKRIGVTVHVRGSDEKPVIEVRDKLTRKIVGGIELKRRMKTR